MSPTRLGSLGWVAALLAAPTAWAETAPADDFCRPEEAIITEADRMGSYMRVCPGGEVFISSTGNSILDLRNGQKRWIRAPRDGGSEPYPDGDCQFVLYSGGSGRPTSYGMRFYLLSDLLAAKAEPGLDFFRAEADPPTVKNRATGLAEPMIDLEHDSYYHSLGSRPGKDRNEKVITLQTYQGVRDYRIWFGADGRPQEWEKGPITRYCQRDPDGNPLYADYSMPIVSKDGKLISMNVPGRDGSRFTTKVFRLNGETCELVADIGYAAGKVRFDSPAPGKLGRIVYTAQNSNDAEGGAKLVVYDLDAKQEISFPARINGKSARSITYPGFSEDGRIIGLVSVDGYKTHLVGFRLPSLKSRISQDELKSDPGLACFKGNMQLYTKALESIGNVWGELCKDSLDPNAGSGEALALSLNPHQCAQAVRSSKFARALRKKPKRGLALKHLLAACPRYIRPGEDANSGANPAPAAPSQRAEVGAGGSSESPSRASSPHPRAAAIARAMGVLNARNCLACHVAGGYTPIDFESILRDPYLTVGSLNRRGGDLLLDALVGANGVPRMPMGGSEIPSVELGVIREALGLRPEVEQMGSSGRSIIRDAALQVATRRCVECHSTGAHVINFPRILRNGGWERAPGGRRWREVILDALTGRNGVPRMPPVEPPLSDTDRRRFRAVFEMDAGEFEAAPGADASPMPSSTPSRAGGIGGAMGSPAVLASPIPGGGFGGGAGQPSSNRHD